MQTIFDGTSFDGWTQSACVLQDGAATDAPRAQTDINGCSMAYTAPMSNVVVRAAVRRYNFFDNAAFGMGHEIQMRSVGEYLPGGYFNEYPARSQKLASWPDWSEMEVIQLGARYVVKVNGRTVTDHVASTGAPAPYKLSLSSQPIFSYRTGTENGFGWETNPSVTIPSDWGHFWWRNVQVHYCNGPDDPACAAAADTDLGEAPAR
jgi:hypothetical protein